MGLQAPTPRILAAWLLLCASWTCCVHGERVAAVAKLNPVQAKDQELLQSFMRRQSEARPATAGATLQHVSEETPGIKIIFRGPEYASFDRPLPVVVEKTLFQDFEEYFNQTQAFQAEGPNTHEATGRQVVVSVAGGRVSGVLGEVRNAQGQLLAEFSARSEATLIKVGNQAASAGPCKHFKRLATGIQKYGHMYHHFVLEVLPRVILLRPFLDSDTKVLLFGSAHEYKWLAQLGIPAEQVEVYDPSVEYCADELLVPSMSPIITPPKENYELLQAAFQADDASLDDESSDLIIYCSRRDAHERIVSNEGDLLAAIQKRYPSSELYVYTGQESVLQTVRLFRRASVVVGMHGAGLSHLVFAPRGTAVVEFLFMPDPPMMFWHAASALEQQYIMVPLAQSWWLQRTVTVPEQDVLDALALALMVAEGDCKPGSYKPTATAECTACPAGTYRALGASACLACAAGRYSDEGAAFCSTCPAGTFSDEQGLTCTPCPEEGATLFPGANSVSQCASDDEIEGQLDSMFNKNLLVSKLVSLPAFEAERPTTTAEWIAAAVSPSHWQRVLRQRQLKTQYLNELFNTEVQAQDEEADNQRRLGQAAHRRMLITGYHRQLISGYARQLISGYRRQLFSGYHRQLFSGYHRQLFSGYRRQLFSGYRRQLFSGYRRQLFSGYRRQLVSGYRRHLSSGYRRRHMLAYH